MNSTFLRSYPSKGPSLIPSTRPNIFQTQYSIAKPSSIQSFNPSKLLTYVPSEYPSKYHKVVPSNDPIITTFWYSISHHFWSLFHTIQPTTNTNTKTSHYIIIFQYFLLIFYVLNIPKRGRNWNHSLVPIRAASVTSITFMFKSCLSSLQWNWISN